MASRWRWSKPNALHETSWQANAQAADYADAIKAKFGQDPFIFLTNGKEIQFWDRERYALRRVSGFYTRDDLERLRHQRQFAQPLDGVAINADIAGRDYQNEAIHRVTEGVDAAKRKFLLVMATGTGKTRTTIALVDTLLRSKRVQRVRSRSRTASTAGRCCWWANRSARRWPLRPARSSASSLRGCCSSRRGTGSHASVHTTTHGCRSNGCCATSTTRRPDWRKIDRPVVAAVAERDSIVPARFGTARHAELDGPKRLLVIEAADHNDWPYRVDAGWWRAATAFALGVGFS